MSTLMHRLTNDRSKRLKEIIKREKKKRPSREL